MTEIAEKYGNGAEKRPLTAVEWLVEMVSKMGYVSTDIFEQAKEMEKEQIMEAWDNGFANGHDLGKYNDDCSPEDAEQYYNETYGKP